MAYCKYYTWYSLEGMSTCQNWGITAIWGNFFRKMITKWNLFNVFHTFLGLTPLHGVGIMAHNHPNWFVSSLASIFAGGLSCGIYTTNSPATGDWLFLAMVHKSFNFLLTLLLKSQVCVQNLKWY